MTALKIFFYAMILAALACIAPLAPAQPLTTLASFDGTNGQLPLYGSLVQGSDGSLYGTTVFGGVNYACYFSCGTVFKVTPTGALTTLYSFCTPDCTYGFYPEAELVQGTDGNFYGTTAAGGFYNSPNCGGTGCGTVFKITPTGTLTTLHRFCSGGTCADGAAPYAPLVQGSDGNFYGTTMYGGVNGGAGAVFKITATGTLVTLYSFCMQYPRCADGAGPYAGLAQGSDGNFYGTTYAGGAMENGTVFKITPSGTLTTLYRFCRQPPCTDGSHPLAGLVLATDGNFYGTTQQGGSTNGQVCPNGATRVTSRPAEFA